MLADQKHQQGGFVDGQMENLGEDVRRRRWNFMGHIMRKGHDNDCMTPMTWAPEERQRRRRLRTTWRRTAEKERE